MSIWFEIWPVDVERILREPSKDDQWSSLPGEKIPSKLEVAPLYAKCGVGDG